MFGLQEGFHSLGSQFASPTAFLDATEWGLAGGWCSVIDPDGPGLILRAESATKT